MDIEFWRKGKSLRAECNYSHLGYMVGKNNNEVFHGMSVVGSMVLISLNMCAMYHTTMG